MKDVWQYLSVDRMLNSSLTKLSKLVGDSLSQRSITLVRTLKGRKVDNFLEQTQIAIGQQS